MKKLNLILISLVSLIVFSSFVSAVTCYKNNDCDDNLKYTKDICENAGTEEAYCINEVTNPKLSLLDKILGKLTEILVKLTIIAEKDTIVIVEPSQIIVNPNITLPEKECRWEKLNQKIELNSKKEEKALIPKDIIYSEIKIINSYLYGECYSPTGGTGGKCIFKINDIPCITVRYDDFGDRIMYFNLPESCYGSFVLGINDFSFFDTRPGKMEFLLLEMEVKTC